MPPSVQYTLEVGTGRTYLNAINTASNLSELLALVPAPYRPRMQNVVYDVYNAAVKSNNTRSYLATLEKHVSDGTFPPEIGGRIAAPALQISKEFAASAGYRSTKAGIDSDTTAHKKQMLQSAIELKKQELAFLQRVFSEDSYREETDAVLKETSSKLVSDAGLSTNAPDASTPVESWPAWIADDYAKMEKCRMQFPARAIALAFTKVSTEVSQKFRGLTLKKTTDNDTEMQEGNRQETVDDIVQRKLEQYMKDHKLQKVGNEGQAKKRKANPSKQRGNPNGKVPFKVGKGVNSRGGKGGGKKQTRK